MLSDAPVSSREEWKVSPAQLIHLLFAHLPSVFEDLNVHVLTSQQHIQLLEDYFRSTFLTKSFIELGNILADIAA